MRVEEGATVPEMHIQEAESGNADVFQAEGTAPAKAQRMQARSAWGTASSRQRPSQDMCALMHLRPREDPAPAYQGGPRHQHAEWLRHGVDWSRFSQVCQALCPRRVHVDISQ